MDDGDNDGEDRQNHPAIEVSLTHSLEQLRHIAYEATPRPENLFIEQRALLRTATARIYRKGLSTDTETYRRLGILVPHRKHPAQFEAVLYELRDYWKHHNSAISLGRSYPFRKVREKAGNYLRMMARRSQGEEDSDDDDDDGDSDDEDRDNPDNCKLPSATMVRVFRLVNGSLEIPPTLFKALAMAGRIKDAFFPDEPSTWKQGPGVRGLGGMDDYNTDASTEASFNGTQTDPDSEPSSDEDDDNQDDDDDDDVVAIERDEFEEGAPFQVDNQVRQAAVQFFQQMQAARPRPNDGNNNGRGNGSGVGPFGGMNFNALPEVIRRIFGFGNNPAPAPQIPMEIPAAQPNLVFCPMPFMVMPMAMGQAGMGQNGVGDMMMNAMQSMMNQMVGGSSNASGSGIGSDSGGSIFGSGSNARPTHPKLLLQPSVKDEDGNDSSSSLFMARYGAGSASSRTTSGSKRTHSSTMDSTRGNSDNRKKAKTTSSTSSAVFSTSSSSSTVASSSRTPLPSSSRSASRSALNVVNASGKRKETFYEYQLRRARHIEKKRYKASKK